MKAIIFNSGIGSRMRPFTNENPKCLIKPNEKTILGHEIENLLHYGIKDIIITVGPFEEKIKKFMKDNFPEVNATYVKNPKYESTNCIYSMWLTRHLINDDILWMHGDMVFEKELLGKLLNTKHESCALVNNKIELPKKDFKGLVKDNLIKKIGVDIFGEGAFFLAPVYKFSKDDFMLLLKEIAKFVENGNVNVYAENAFNNISDKIKLYPVYYADEFCMEIDDFEDFEIARDYFRNKN
ncbi:nucleotidyltransferase [Candidatus Woesearchaeota archaeon]|nr:nucleotidyltransferase [Candidatus Woesearchaeota archaeon]|tara:strand:+ start:714 stop:1430 length:717 start_codon:yes stop_codon:yes gene_type:complete